MVSDNFMKCIKERIATCGLSPSYRIEAFNLLLEFGKWLESNEFKVTFQSRYDLYQYINNDVTNNSPIDYFEFGVHKGMSMKYWVQLNQHPNSRFFGFDTFEGLPEDWRLFTTTLPKGAFNTEGRMPEIEDPRANFIKGLFQTSLPVFLKSYIVENRLIINCDADLYTSTLYVLAKLDHLMKPGTIVIFDEFSTLDEFRAFRDFTRSFRRDYKLLADADRFHLKVAVEFA